MPRRCKLISHPCTSSGSNVTENLLKSLYLVGCIGIGRPPGIGIELFIVVIERFASGVEQQSVPLAHQMQTAAGAAVCRGMWLLFLGFSGRLLLRMFPLIEITRHTESDDSQYYI